MDWPAAGHYSTRMDLAFRELGGEGDGNDGGPVVILHGLFGSSQNWVGMGRKLSSLGACLCGGPAQPRRLAACAVAFAGRLRAGSRGLGTRARAASLRLIGHSMGGLVAMGFALAHAELAAGVATIDIAPRPYPPEHGQELRALKTDISGAAGAAPMSTQLLLPDHPRHRAPAVPPDERRQGR